MRDDNEVYDTHTRANMSESTLQIVANTLVHDDDDGRECM
jgi:hypothetical protein